jgi:hypothetical protein
MRNNRLSRGKRHHQKDWKVKSNQKSGVQTILVEKNLVKTSPSPVAYVARGPLKCQKITSRVQNCTILTEHNGLAAYLSYLAWIFSGSSEGWNAPFKVGMFTGESGRWCKFLLCWDHERWILWIHGWLVLMEMCLFHTPVKTVLFSEGISNQPRLENRVVFTHGSFRVPAKDGIASNRKFMQSHDIVRTCFSHLSPGFGLWKMLTYQPSYPISLSTSGNLFHLRTKQYTPVMRPVVPVMTWFVFCKSPASSIYDKA